MHNTMSSSSSTQHTQEHLDKSQITSRVPSNSASNHDLKFTPIDEIPHIVASLRNDTVNNEALFPPPHDVRAEQLTRLIAMFTENKARWNEAIHNDLRQNRLLTHSEVDSSIQEAKHQLSHLRQNMHPQSVKTSNPIVEPSSSHLYPEPLGLVLIISPWNYPISLLAKPLAGALAAGNAVILKPSEVSAHVSAVFADLVPKYLDERWVRIVVGGVDETQRILEERFDYIFYTGSTQVGKIVMAAAAKYLTPLTLELGGKSPCYVDKNVDFKTMLHRLTWGKWLNKGQTCVAPDYILVHRELTERFIQGVKERLRTFYGEDPRVCADYSRIINERHTQRIHSLLDDQAERIVHGGTMHLEDRYIEPTIVLNPPLDSRLMTEEIFGPILPVIEVNDHNEAIRIINSREKPLALYAFSKSQTVLDAFTKRTSSGGVCYNDTIVHILTHELPFGGVGHSGHGRYNGKATFDTFTHYKPVLSKSTWIDPSIRYPPYTDKKMQFIEATSSMKVPKCVIQ